MPQVSQDIGLEIVALSRMIEDGSSGSHLRHRPGSMELMEFHFLLEKVSISHSIPHGALVEDVECSIRLHRAVE